MLSSRPALGQQTTTVSGKLGGVTQCIPVGPDTSVALRPVGVAEAKLPLCRVPISPGRAFFISLGAPGLAQVRLARPKAAGIFLIAEAGTIGMSIKSWRDLAEAKAARRDTILVPLVDEVTGAPVIDPVTGLQRTVGRPRNQNLADRVNVRRTHLEDWLAAVAFNHLFAAADAYVAANLADFKTNIEATASGRGMRVLARVAW